MKKGMPTMVRVLVAALLIILGPVAGYLYAQKDKLHSDLTIPLADGTPSPSGLDDLNCKGIVDATAEENLLTNNARALSGVSEAAASVQFSPDKEGINVLFNHDVANGRSGGRMLRIVSTSDPYVVAVGSEALTSHSMILNVKTLKAVYSFNGQEKQGMIGISTLLTCSRTSATRPREMSASGR
jgi:hypothetical protein